MAATLHWGVDWSRGLVWSSSSRRVKPSTAHQWTAGQLRAAGLATHRGASVLDGDQRLIEPRTSWQEIFLLNPFVGWLE